MTGSVAGNGHAGREAEVVVAGHVCVDLVPRLDSAPTVMPGQLSQVGPLSVRAGGCVANTGLDLAALGASVRLVADVGDDHLGSTLRGLLRHPNADASEIRVVAGDTSYSIVVQPPGGDRSLWHHVGVNEGFEAHRLHPDGAALLHLGYPTALPALYRAGGTRLRQVLADVREQGGATTSVDLATFEPGSPAAGEDWRLLLDRSLPLIDVFATSLDDMECVLGSVDRTGSGSLQLAHELIAGGAAAVLVKAGSGGLYLVTAGEERLRHAGRGLQPVARRWANQCLWAPSIDVDVVGTAGAGDAAVAGLLFGIARGLAPISALGVAAVAAAARVSGRGRLSSWSELSRRFGDGRVVEVPVPPRHGRMASERSGSTR